MLSDDERHVDVMISCNWSGITSVWTPDTLPIAPIPAILTCSQSGPEIEQQ